MVKRGGVRILLGMVLILSALILTVYNVGTEYRAGISAEDTLKELVSASGSAMGEEFAYPDYLLNPSMEMPVKRIGRFDYIGVLDLPDLGLSLPVISEWSYAGLKKAPCRYAGSAYLDNMVICAHNYRTHFGGIKNLSAGNSVVFTDIDGNVFTYQVTDIEILRPYASEEMVSGDWDLTLFTCTVGGARRVTVRCRRLNNDTPWGCFLP